MELCGVGGVKTTKARIYIEKTAPGRIVNFNRLDKPKTQAQLPIYSALRTESSGADIARWRRPPWRRRRRRHQKVEAANAVVKSRCRWRRWRHAGGEPAKVVGRRRLHVVEPRAAGAAAAAAAATGEAVGGDEGERNRAGVADWG